MSSGVDRARRVGVVVALLAAALLVTGAVVPRWWTGTERSMDHGVGLRGVELCAAGDCIMRPLDDLGARSRSWPLLAVTAFAMSWVAAAFLIAAAIMAARRTSSASAWRLRVARAEA